jgi:hypothetical protein
VRYLSPLLCKSIDKPRAKLICITQLLFQLQRKYDTPPHEGHKLGTYPLKIFIRTAALCKIEQLAAVCTKRVLCQLLHSVNTLTYFEHLKSLSSGDNFRPPLPGKMSALCIDYTIPSVSPSVT